MSWSNMVSWFCLLPLIALMLTLQASHILEIRGCSLGSSRYSWAFIRCLVDFMLIPIMCSTESIAMSVHIVINLILSGETQSMTNRVGSKAFALLLISRIMNTTLNLYEAAPLTYHIGLNRCLLNYHTLLNMFMFPRGTSNCGFHIPYWAIWPS